MQFEKAYKSSDQISVMLFKVSNEINKIYIYLNVMLDIQWMHQEAAGRASADNFA